MRGYKGFLLLVLCITLFLCGCTAEIATKSQLLRFAKNNYGEAECLNYYVDDGRSYVILKDAEYGFEYPVWSYVADISFDGSKFGEHESKGSDFLERYIAYIETDVGDDFAALEDRHDCYYKWNKHYSPKEYDGSTVISVYISDEENAEIIAKDFNDLIRQVDSRQFFSNGKIYVYNGEDSIGGYSLLTDKYKTGEEMNIEWAMENAAIIMNGYMEININSANELSYMYTEIMDVKDIPGYDINNNTFRITDTAESIANTAVYHYEFKKEEWIVADCIVAPYGHLYVHKLER